MTQPPYSVATERQLRKAHRALFRQVQRLVKDYHAILASDLRAEMSRIADELERRKS